MCSIQTQHACSRDIQGAQYCDISPFKQKSMCTDDKSTTSSKESISMYLTYVPQVHIHENREPTYKLSFVGGLTVRPLLVLFMLVFVSSTISLSVLVCTSVNRRQSDHQCVSRRQSPSLVCQQETIAIISVFKQNFLDFQKT